jgi:aerobic C4-dicarboxylate transport protein
MLMLTSKGAAAVTGGGFITLAATLAVFPSIPIAGLTLLLGVDRFMAEARSITNLIGNGVATLVVARWDGQLDMESVNRVLDGARAQEMADEFTNRDEVGLPDVEVTEMGPGTPETATVPSAQL